MTITLIRAAARASAGKPPAVSSDTVTRSASAPATPAAARPPRTSSAPGSCRSRHPRRVRRRGRAALTRREGRLDVLINNAGVFEGMLKPDEITAADMERIYAVNVFGVVRMTHAFLSPLRVSASPVIVNVSGGLGSFGVVTDPASRESAFSIPVCGSSKAAVGMLTVQYARACRSCASTRPIPALPRPT